MNRRILIVDDEQRIADTLSMVLQLGGYVTATAYDGASALEVSESFRPDLVITDAVMPGMGGIELAKALREKFPDCKILLFSGQAGAAAMMHDSHSEIPLLSKPIHPTDLLKKVEEIFAPYEQAS